MFIKTYTEAVETLFKKEETLDYSLEKMQKAASFFGNPQDSYTNLLNLGQSSL